MLRRSFTHTGKQIVSNRIIFIDKILIYAIKQEHDLIQCWKKDWSPSVEYIFDIN